MYAPSTVACQAWIEDERLYIQTELCETSLEKQLESGHRLEIDGVYAFLRQTLLGLDILHQHKLVHLDIKVCLCVLLCADPLGPVFLQGRWLRFGVLSYGQRRYREQQRQDVPLCLPQVDVFQLAKVRHTKYGRCYPKRLVLCLLL